VSSAAGTPCPALIEANKRQNEPATVTHRVRISSTPCYLRTDFASDAPMSKRSATAEHGAGQPSPDLSASSARHVGGPPPCWAADRHERAFGLPSGKAKGESNSPSTCSLRWIARGQNRYTELELTAAGRRRLAAERERWQGLAAAIARLRALRIDSIMALRDE
jgi:hypothetical protein